MATKAKKAPPCPMCGETQDNPVDRLAHMLMAHGPLANGVKPRKRKKMKAMLPQLHRRLEEAGFDEGQAHRIITLLAEELRTAGLI